jgi:putative ABC transport system permease protein
MKKEIVPPLATRLLNSFLRSDLAEEVRGDLEEKFYSDVKNKTLFKAKVNYWYQVLNYLRPFAIQKSKASHLDQYDMYQSYFKIGWRNLVKNKSYSAINISGLALGMAVAILIGLWVFDELSFNKSFANYHRLGKVYHHLTFGENVMTLDNVPHAIGGGLKNNFAEFDEVAMAVESLEHIVSYEENKISKAGLFVEPQFVRMFSLPLLQGTDAALKDIHSILLSKTLANALFGGSAVGKLIKFDNQDNLLVTGVFEDFPSNSQFEEIKMLLPIDYFFSMRESNRKLLNSWEHYDFECFVLLNEKASFEQVDSKIKKVLNQNASNDGKSLKPDGFIFPMEKWHLYAEFKEGKNVGGKIQFVWMFGIVGVFVLVLACINFMNLSTAQSEKRSKEVGIRKVMGSVRNQLVNQFLSESFLVVIIAFLTALLMVVLSLPLFNELASKQMTIPWGNSYFILISLLFVFITSLLAGSYPALYLSAFNPVKVLKGTFKAGRFAAAPRKIMVVFQFVISTSLIIGTIVVFQQIQHAKNRPVGFDREGIIHIAARTQDLAKANYNSLRNDLLSTGAVENVAQSDYPTTGGMSSEASLTWEGKDPASRPMVVMNSCSHDFPTTNGFQFIEGRDFSREFSTDSSAIIVNEMAAKLFSDKSAIGKKIKWGYGKEREIIGMIKDQVRWTPFSKQSPHIYYINYAEMGYLTIRLKSTIGVRDALTKIETVLKKYDPGAPFDYKFLDDDYARLFKDEERIGKIASVFAALAIFISCLGIFGLASFSASQRTKEIGIRKVLGASVLTIWKMLSRDFVWLVIVSILLATPLAYYFSNQWLQKYDYRIEISWWIFIMTGGGALAITLLTVSYQSIKAALMNPVNSLKSE